MAINGEDRDFYYLISVQSEFTVKTLVDIRQAVQAGMAAGHKIIIFNMSVCTFMDSSGVGMLTNLNRKIIAEGGQLGFLKPKGEIRSLLAVTELSSIIKIYKTEASIDKDLEDVRRQMRVNRARSLIDQKR